MLTLCAPVVFRGPSFHATLTIYFLVSCQKVLFTFNKSLLVLKLLIGWFYIRNVQELLCAKGNLKGLANNNPILPSALVASQFQGMALNFKAVSGLGPGYLKDHFLPHIPIWTIRKSSEVLFWVPFSS